MIHLIINNNNKNITQQENNQQQNKESIFNIFTLINFLYDLINGRIIYITDENSNDDSNDYYDHIIHNLIKKFLFFLKNTILFIIKILNKFHYEIKKYIPYPYDYLLMTFLDYILTDLLIPKKSCISIKKQNQLLIKIFLLLIKK